jgi:hypothetical protein
MGRERKKEKKEGGVESRGRGRHLICIVGLFYVYSRSLLKCDADKYGIL